MTDWWYSYEPCEKFMRTAGRIAEVSLCDVQRGAPARKACLYVPTLTPAARSLESISTELVLGPVCAGKRRKRESVQIRLDVRELAAHRW
jgi:hypothetical protein